MSSFNPLPDGPKRPSWRWVLAAVTVAVIYAIGPKAFDALQKSESSEPDCPTEPAFTNWFQKEEYLQLAESIEKDWSNPLVRGKHNRYKNEYRDSFRWSPGDGDQFIEKRAELYRKMVVRELGERFDLATDELHEDLATVMKDRPIDLGSGVLEGIFVRKAERVRYDCDSQQYVYEMALASRFDRLFPEAIKNPVRQRLRQLDTYRQHLKDPLNFTIDIESIAQQFDQDQSFKSNYCQLIQAHEDRLHYFYPNLNAQNCNMDFARGDYQLNALQVLIIQLIAQEYLDFVENYPNEQFEIQIQGYADATHIRPSGIAYSGRARWSDQTEHLDLNGTSGTEIAPLLTQKNQGNQQLSYIRAYTGATQLQWALLNCSEQGLPENLHITYVGKHLPSAPGQVGDRRLEFQLKKSTHHAS